MHLLKTSSARDLEFYTNVSSTSPIRERVKNASTGGETAAQQLAIGKQLADLARAKKSNPNKRSAAANKKHEVLCLERASSQASSMGAADDGEPFDAAATAAGATRQSGGHPLHTQMEWLNKTEYAQNGSLRKIFGGDANGKQVVPSQAFMDMNTKVVAQLEERRRRMRYVYRPGHSKLVNAWDVVTTTALLYTASVTPFEVAFLSSRDDWTVWTDPLFLINRVRPAADARCRRPLQTDSNLYSSPGGRPWGLYWCPR